MTNAMNDSQQSVSQGAVKLTTSEKWTAILFLLSTSLIGNAPAILTFAFDPSASHRIGLTEIFIPGWVFTTVFIFNYAGMGIATWMIWRKRRVADVSVPLVVFAAAFIETLLFWATDSLRMTATIDVIGLTLAYTVAWVYSRYEKAAVWWLIPWLVWMPFTTAVKLWLLWK